MGFFSHLFGNGGKEPTFISTPTTIGNVVNKVDIRKYIIETLNLKDAVFLDLMPDDSISNLATAISILENTTAFEVESPDEDTWREMTKILRRLVDVTSSVGTVSHDV